MTKNGTIAVPSVFAQDAKKSRPDAVAGGPSANASRRSACDSAGRSTRNMPT